MSATTFLEERLLVALMSAPTQGQIPYNFELVGA